MAALDYAAVPIYARLMPIESGEDQAIPKEGGISSNSSGSSLAVGDRSRTRPGSLNLSNILISSAINIPNTLDTSSSPRSSSSALLSTRDPLALQLMTYNFRRFVSRVGFLFWIMDKIEEIVMWRKGWVHTVPWIFGYGFICE